jgi:hypothetical protein
VSNGECPICHSPATREHGTKFVDIRCIRCGRFLVSLSEGLTSITSVEHMARLSGWIREQNAADNVPIIGPEVLRRISSMRLPSYSERALKALRVLAAKYPWLDGWTAVTTATQDAEVAGPSYSGSSDEVGVLLRVLSHDDFLEIDESGSAFHLTVRGLLAVEAMAGPGSISARGFVAMDFAEGMRDAWTNGFDPGIRAAGFQPIRIDAKDYVGGITDEIMAEIRSSRFVVADYTGQKAGVYFEAGFALGLKLTVIPTCRADQIANLHFDIRHLNTLAWTAPSDLAASLAKRIRAVVGVGPNLQAAPDGT